MHIQFNHFSKALFLSFFLSHSLNANTSLQCHSLFEKKKTSFLAKVMGFAKSQKDTPVPFDRAEYEKQKLMDLDYLREDFSSISVHHLYEDLTEQQFKDYFTPYVNQLIIPTNNFNSEFSYNAKFYQHKLDNIQFLIPMMAKLKRLFAKGMTPSELKANLSKLETISYFLDYRYDGLVSNPTKIFPFLYKCDHPDYETFISINQKLSERFELHSLTKPNSQVNTEFEAILKAFSNSSEKTFSKQTILQLLKIYQEKFTSEIEELNLMPLFESQYAVFGENTFELQKLKESLAEKAKNNLKRLGNFINITDLTLLKKYEKYTQYFSQKQIPDLYKKLDSLIWFKALPTEDKLRTYILFSYALSKADKSNSSVQKKLLLNSVNFFIENMNNPLTFGNNLKLKGSEGKECGGYCQKMNSQKPGEILKIAINSNDFMTNMDFNVQVLAHEVTHAVSNFNTKHESVEYFVEELRAYQVGFYAQYGRLPNLKEIKERIKSNFEYYDSINEAWKSRRGLSLVPNAWIEKSMNINDHQVNDKFNYRLYKNYNFDGFTDFNSILALYGLKRRMERAATSAYSFVDYYDNLFSNSNLIPPIIGRDGLPVYFNDQGQVLVGSDTGLLLNQPYTEEK